MRGRFSIAAMAGCAAVAACAVMASSAVARMRWEAQAAAPMREVAPVVTPELAARAREIVSRMQAAIAKGDAEAYLRLIDQAEPEWWQEQRNWAKDIASKTPLTVELSLDDDMTTGEAWVDATLNWAWTVRPDERVTSGEATPGSEKHAAENKPRTLAFRARFVERGGELRYAGEAWKTVEREGVVVCFDPGLEEAAHAAAEAFLKIRGGVEEELGLRGQRISSQVQRIKLYGNMQHLQHSIYPSYVFPLSGWNEPGEAIKALTGPGEREDDFVALLAHEYGHVASFELGPQANSMPWWLLEGLAEQMVEPHDATLAERSRKAVQRWARKGTLSPLAELADFEKVPLALHGRVYRQGHDMMRHVTTRYGREARSAWLRELAGGSDLDGASRRALGEPWERIEQAWKDEITTSADRADEPATRDAAPKEAGTP